MQEDMKVERIVCNQCKKEIKVIDGVAQEGVVSIEKKWGYFSDKDGEIHRFDLCESCYDRFIAGFELAAEIV